MHFTRWYKALQLKDMSWKFKFWLFMTVKLKVFKHLIIHRETEKDTPGGVKGITVTDQDPNNSDFMTFTKDKKDETR